MKYIQINNIKNIYLLFLSVLLIFLVIIFIVHLNKPLNHNIENITYSNKSIDYQQYLINEIEGCIIDSLFEGINKKRFVLYYRYNTMSCQVCLESTISIVKKISINSNFYDKIAIVGNFTSYNELEILNREFDGKIQIYMQQIDKTYDLSIEKLYYSYFFLIDENNRIKDVFIPNKNFIGLTRKYLIDRLQ